MSLKDRVSEILVRLSQSVRLHSRRTRLANSAQTRGHFVERRDALPVPCGIAQGELGRRRSRRRGESCPRFRTDGRGGRRGRPRRSGLPDAGGAPDGRSGGRRRASRLHPRRRAISALTEAVEGVEPLHTMALTAAPLLAGSVEPGPVPASPEDGSPEDGPPEAPPQPPPETDVLPPLVIAVPEPSTWIMMIVGFGAVGGALRRAGRRFARA